MTNEQLKNLEAKLWDAANDLRANSKLTAAEYKDPVLGLLLLRYAHNKFIEAKIEIEKDLKINPRTGKKRDLTKDDFLAAGSLYLRDKSKFDSIANLPESENIADAVNNAMKLIEEDYPDLQGILPKNYQNFEANLLRSLVRVFNEDLVKSISGDIFGRIYEFFLMKFSMQGAGAQEGGEFFTPPSLVKTIVNFIEPEKGIIHDPACGSGGMFVQTSYFVKDHTNNKVNESISVYGTEYKSNTTKMAKMNLAIHGIEGKIIEGNSYYTDPHNLVGKCDYVMANPPFNAKKIDKQSDFVKSDQRLPFGPPKADNGNYMWIQYFYSYLNEKGRAGFVMASSATDAGNTEKDIRKELIETGAVDIIVSIGNNFFYTRSLPCHLWFLDKGKSDYLKNKVLMIDARNIFKTVSSTINDFSDGQNLNLKTIVDLYRGNESAIDEAEAIYKISTTRIFDNIIAKYNETKEVILELRDELNDKKIPIVPEKLATKQIEEPIDIAYNVVLGSQIATGLKGYAQSLEKEIKQLYDSIEVDPKSLDKKTKSKKAKIKKLHDIANEYEKSTTDYNKELMQWENDWEELQKFFPVGKYEDVEGLCKIVDIEEIIENDYSLTPGRYVGYSINVDENFDYKGRINELHSELEILHNESSILMKKISIGDFG